MCIEIDVPHPLHRLSVCGTLDLLDLVSSVDARMLGVKDSMDGSAFGTALAIRGGNNSLEDDGDILASCLETTSRNTISWKDCR